jgi:hypothetical protein
MRVLIALPLLALAACQVTKDDANDSVTATYNQDLAENVAADVANSAENLAGVIANDVEQSAQKIQQKTENVDVDVNVSTDGNSAN